MNNTVKIVLAVILSAALWLGGVLMFGGIIGMICVILAISVAGYVAGDVMNTECPIKPTKT